MVDSLVAWKNIAKVTSTISRNLEGHDGQRHGAKHPMMITIIIGFVVLPPMAKQAIELKETPGMVPATFTVSMILDQKNYVTAVTTAATRTCRYKGGNRQRWRKNRYPMVLPRGLCRPRPDEGKPGFSDRQREYRDFFSY